ncbi:hypothetical protein [Candidatus Enterovibrio escicola]|uniref:hypothetical protein n=1 Tax=Candidatus Enterovibrio escicola TaxID=1927127 RepID=UPI0012380DD9|nr:hypothetical protein [Candidatus Enterovibrio escacola]
MTDTPRLEVYKDHSILITEDGIKERFDEGGQSKETKKRLVLIKNELEKGFLVNIVEECRHPSHTAQLLSDEYMKILRNLVNSVTSEVGRGVVGLAVLQVTTPRPNRARLLVS